jgi:hypothetical protein
MRSLLAGVRSPAVLLLVLPAIASLQPRQTATIPDFVNKYGAVAPVLAHFLAALLMRSTAPLVYLDQNELCLPSDIGAQLNHTTPTINFTAIKNAPSPLTLSNLDQLNSIASCTTDNISGCPLYLTSKDNVTANPSWLYGVLPDPVTGEAMGTKSCAIIVTDHGDGIVDAFYMYFYAFNLGQTVFGQVLGDHVGDWEHTMVRFTNGTPTTMWFSQHDVSL